MPCSKEDERDVFTRTREVSSKRSDGAADVWLFNSEAVATTTTLSGPPQSASLPHGGTARTKCIRVRKRTYDETLSTKLEAFSKPSIHTSPLRMSQSHSLQPACGRRTGCDRTREIEDDLLTINPSSGQGMIAVRHSRRLVGQSGIKREPPGASRR